MKFLSLVLLTLSVTIAIGPLAAQHCPMPLEKLNKGMPWTYVPDDQLPECYPGDSAHLARMLGYTRGVPHPEIRYVYRVYNHPELIEFGEGVGWGSIQVELPRNPGESEVVTFTRVVDDGVGGPNGSGDLSFDGFIGLDPVNYGKGTLQYNWFDENLEPNFPSAD